jgi:hypothetical protein
MTEQPVPSRTEIEAPVEVMQEPAKPEASRAELISWAWRFWDGEPVELVILNTEHYGTVAGFFDDLEKMVDEVMSPFVQGLQRSIYFSAQGIDPHKVTVTNKLATNVRNRLSDAQVHRYKSLLIDCDPVRGVKNTSATEEEKEKAYLVALRVRYLFIKLGFQPTLVDSGNGYHVYVPLHIGNTETANFLMRDVIRALKFHFGTDAVTIDSSVYSPGQLMKLPGTVARKGGDTEDRPHRMAAVVDARDASSYLDQQFLEVLLEKLIESLPEEQRAAFKPTEHREPADDAEVERALRELRAFLKHFRIPVTGEKFENGLHMFIVRCPNGEQHHSGSHSSESFVGVNDKAQMLFKCKHPSCTLCSFDNDTVPIQKFLKFVDPLSEFKFTLPTGDPSYQFYMGMERATPDAVKTAVSATIALPAGKIPFTHPKVLGATRNDYVFGPKVVQFSDPKDFSQTKGKYDGWFPRSSLSLVGGSSGAGKTSWLVPLVMKQAKGESHEGHPSYGLPYLLFMRDRGGFSMERTLEQLGLINDPEVHRNLVRVKDIGVAVIAQILRAIERYIDERGKVPGVIVLDGLDICAGKQKDMDTVSAFLDDLIEIAEHFNLAVVGIVGAPKKLEKDGNFTSRRDELYGSVAFGRMAETIVHVTLDEQDVRCYDIMHRNSKGEKFYMKFDDNGNLVRHVPEASEESEPDLPAVAFARTQEGYWTSKEYQEATGHIKATANRHIQAAKDDRKIREKPGKAAGHAAQYILVGKAEPVERGQGQ